LEDCAGAALEEVNGLLVGDSAAYHKF
jgi:hypothetical protein